MNKESIFKTIERLEKENKDREVKVEQMGRQREELLVGIQRSKEEHDFCRGQLSALKSLTEEKPASPVTQVNPAELVQTGTTNDFA